MESSQKLLFCRNQYQKKQKEQENVLNLLRHEARKVATPQRISRHNRRLDGIICVATLQLMLRHKHEESLEKQLNNVATLTNLLPHSSERSVE